jgi:hypothetical protein
MLILIYNIDMLTQFKRNCTVNIKSNRLMSCLSLSTMCLLILASIVIITIISVTPIIILGLGEIQAGQRDLILTPLNSYMNSTKISDISGHQVMARVESNVLIGT